MAIQQTDKISFGTARLYALPAGATQRVKYADLNDLEVGIKVDLKEAYGENGFPISVADGHRSIDLTAKHYTLRLDAIANDLGLSAATTGTKPFAIDEAVVVPTTPFKYTPAQTATFIAGSADLIMYVLSGTVYVPVTYQFVTAGTEVAGVSASITAAGVITFNGTDVGLTGKLTYQYTAAATGSTLAIPNTYQNSGSVMSMVAVKRDKSPLDNSTGFLIYTFNAVRSGGVKTAHKEGEFTVYERTFKAYSDPLGNVGSIQFVNQ
jgi:hypothetical protein